MKNSFTKTNIILLVNFIILIVSITQAQMMKVELEEISINSYSIIKGVVKAK